MKSSQQRAPRVCKKGLVAALLFISSLPGVFAQDATLSHNALGMFRMQLPADQFYLLCNPFNPERAGEDRLGDVVKGDIPQATQVFIWDAIDQQYYAYAWLNSIQSWFPSNPPLERGTAFFIRASGPADITLQGEVPGTTTGQPDIDLELGFNAHGYPFPFPTTLGDSGLDAATSPGDYIYLWDNTIGDWVFSARISAPQGSPQWTNPTLQLGVGASWFLMNRSTATTWQPTVPYAWPNN